MKSEDRGVQERSTPAETGYRQTPQAREREREEREREREMSDQHYVNVETNLERLVSKTIETRNMYASRVRMSKKERDSFFDFCIGRTHAAYVPYPLSQIKICQSNDRRSPLDFQAQFSE